MIVFFTLEVHFEKLFNYLAPQCCMWEGAMICGSLLFALNVEFLSHFRIVCCARLKQSWYNNVFSLPITKFARTNIVTKSWLPTFLEIVTCCNVMQLELSHTHTRKFVDPKRHSLEPGKNFESCTHKSKAWQASINFMLGYNFNTVIIFDCS